MKPVFSAIEGKQSVRIECVNNEGFSRLATEDHLKCGMLSRWLWRIETRGGHEDVDVSARNGHSSDVQAAREDKSNKETKTRRYIAGYSSQIQMLRRMARLVSLARAEHIGPF